VVGCGSDGNCRSAGLISSSTLLFISSLFFSFISLFLLSLGFVPFFSLCRLFLSFLSSVSSFFSYAKQLDEVMMIQARGRPVKEGRGDCGSFGATVTALRRGGGSSCRRHGAVLRRGGGSSCRRHCAVLILAGHHGWVSFDLTVGAQRTWRRGLGCCVGSFVNPRWDRDEEMVAGLNLNMDDDDWIVLGTGLWWWMI
jgi:hypothetical protein